MAGHVAAYVASVPNTHLSLFRSVSEHLAAAPDHLEDALVGG